MHKGTQPGKLAAKLAGKIAHVKHQPVKSEDDWSVAMENELQDLTGQFNQLKQGQRPPCTAGCQRSCLEQHAFTE